MSIVDRCPFNLQLVRYKSRFHHSRSLTQHTKKTTSSTILMHLNRHLRICFFSSPYSCCPKQFVFKIRIAKLQPSTAQPTNTNRDKQQQQLAPGHWIASSVLSSHRIWFLIVWHTLCQINLCRTVARTRHSIVHLFRLNFLQFGHSTPHSTWQVKTCCCRNSDTNRLFSVHTTTKVSLSLSLSANWILEKSTCKLCLSQVGNALGTHSSHTYTTFIYA